MNGKISKDELMKIAEQMHADGKIYSESYAPSCWKLHKWPEVDDDIIYKALDDHLRFLRRIDEYNGGDDG